jgi:hypothetical protein
MNKMFRSMTVFVLAIFFHGWCAVLGAGEKAALFIDVRENARWSYSLNNEVTNIQVSGEETIGGIRCKKIEWRGVDQGLSAYKIEYWQIKHDSIFCAGARLFGKTFVYSSPFLVIAATTKPGDSWKFINGKGALAETVTYKAEGYDSVYATKANRMVGALKISRACKGPTQYRWFSREYGIVMEDSRLE